MVEKKIRVTKIPKPKIIIEEDYHLSYPMIYSENNIDYMISYVGAYDKGLEFDGRTIDNMSTFNFNAGYYINKKYRIGLQVTDLLDRQFEILPGYSAGGREITISLDIST